MHHSLALCGEAGEIANIVKKIDRGSLNIGDEIVLHDLEGETADVLIYLLNIFGLLQVDPLKAYVAKRTFNDKRFRRGPLSGQATAS
jgi:NTP pyrophosphatase (non-canonical NTP hydrolase)